jgi:hypothetical protein
MFCSYSLIAGTEKSVTVRKNTSEAPKREERSIDKND